MIVLGVTCMCVDISCPDVCFFSQLLSEHAKSALEQINMPTPHQWLGNQMYDYLEA